MKKLIAILLVLTMVLSLAACGGDSGSSGTTPGGDKEPANQSGSKDPTTAPTQNQPQQSDDPGENDDPAQGEENEDPSWDNEDEPTETTEPTEPTQTGTDLSDTPNPLGLNSLILAAYLNNATVRNYDTGNYEPVEFTREMLEGIQYISFYYTTLSIDTYYVTNKATATSEDEYEYEDLSITMKVDFIPSLTGSDLDAFWEDLKQAQNLVQFKSYNMEIENLEGLAYHSNLEYISIEYSDSLTSLKGLEGLENLEWLYCKYCSNLADISAVSNLSSLTRAYLTDCNISDVTPLANLTNLEELSLYNNPFSDISPLANLPKLEQLSFGGTQVTELPASGTTRVTDFDYPEGMTGLENLYQWVDDGASLSLMYMEDITLAGFENFTYLTKLHLSGSNITNEDLAYLKNVAIDYLYIEGTPVTDLSGLAGNTGLKEINLSGTLVSDLSPLAGCTSLEAIYAESTPITDVSCLEGLESLTKLNLGGTPITDVSSAAKIPNLKTLRLNHCENLTDVSALVNCANLKYLELDYCTGLTDISALAASATLKSITVTGIEGLDLSAFEGTDISVD